jgi:hypothetical protein
MIAPLQAVTLDLSVVLVGALCVTVLAGLVGAYAAGIGGDEERGGADAEDSAKLEPAAGGDGFRVSTEAKSEGPLGAWLSHREKKKALTEGHVRWHLVGSSFREPMYVTPEREGGGNVRELEHDGEKYEFPEEAAVPSEEDGVPTFVHRVGEADPINLRDGWELAVDAASLKEYLELRVTAQDPNDRGGLLPSDWDAMTVLQYGVAAIVGLFVVLSLMNGGIA